MRKSDSYTILFALVVCLLCSFLLAMASSSFQSIQQTNIEMDRKMNILKAFGAPVVDSAGKKLSAERVREVFADYIRESVIDAQSGTVLSGITVSDLDKAAVASKEKLPLYAWEENGEIRKIAFPVSGKGLWSTIYGYMALKADLSTILGVTFYDHGETPGLGAEIEKPWFQEQFRGKKITRNGALQPLKIIKGKVKEKYPEGNPYAVDGISGASMTGKGVQEFLNRDLALYNRYFTKLREVPDGG